MGAKRKTNRGNNNSNKNERYLNVVNIDFEKKKKEVKIIPRGVNQENYVF